MVNKVLDNYKTFVFDCDGVVLDSNKIKTNAFYQSCLPYGESAALAMVEYHVLNGGVSRFKKFSYFLENIVPKIEPKFKGPTLEQLLDSYARIVEAGLLSCSAVAGLAELRKQYKKVKWLIVSGGDQYELRSIFFQRGLDDIFDGGIFGSPDTKEVILKRELISNNIIKPAVFFGDSRYDYLAASGADLDFIFVSEWTEFPQWREFILSAGVPVIDSISSLRNGSFAVGKFS